LAIAGLFVVGCILGSFLNVVIYRLPRGQSVVRPGSKCPRCGVAIRWYDNVPVLSYLLLRGKCRDCGERINARYPIVELLAGAVPALIYARYGPGPELALYWPLAYALIVLSFVDLDLRILPDKITIPGIAVGLIAAPLLGLETFWNSLIGAAVAGGALYLIALLGAAVFRKESMGGGDIKLAAMLGAFAGWRDVPLMLFLAFFSGAIVGLVLVGTHRTRDGDHAVPFGPFLALGALAVLLWGDVILHWYFALTGRG